MRRRGPLSRSFIVALLCLGFLFVPAAARAQVNIEAVRKQLTPDKNFGARVRFSLATYTGNTEGIIAGVSGLLGGRLRRHLGFAMASTDYARLGGATSMRKSFAHLRHNYELTKWIWWEEFAQSETDRFRRIQFRGLLGTGPRFEILKDKEWLDLFMGHSYMLEYTEVEPKESATEPPVVHRLNNYVALSLRPDDRILLGSILYYQPRFDEISDAHLLSVSSVEFKVTERLQSRMDLTTRYESRPPDGVKTTDVEFKSSLELKF